jgi:internalin A
LIASHHSKISMSRLAHLTALQTLDLTGTEVSDVTPLAHLTALQTLDLSNTEISDLTPLAHLTALQSLDLNYTRVSDVAPLADLAHCDFSNSATPKLATWRHWNT